MSETAPTFSAPEAAPVRVEFTYEFDDFAEASKSWAAPAKGGGKTRLFGKLNRSLLGWVLLIGLAVMLFLLMQNRPSITPGPRRPVPPPAANNYVVNILLPVVPWVLIFLFIWVFVFRQIRAGRIVVETGEKPESSLFEPGAPPPVRPPSPQADAEARSPVVWLLVLLPLTVVAYAVFSYIRPLLDPARRAPSGDILDHITSVLPWLAVVTVIWFSLSRLGGGGGLRGTWEKQHALHRPRVLEADEQRFVIADAVDRFEHRWEAFTHVRETAGLFLLFTSPYMFYFVPKRVFPDAREVDTFRELLRRTVAHRPAPAFPVLPAAPAPPAG